MSPASPSYYDYIYMSSLVYSSIHLLIIYLLIPNILILETAHLTLISVGCAADHLSGRD